VNSRLVSVRQAATKLGLSDGRVRQLIQMGRMPASRVGRTWVIREEELESYAMKERKRGRPLWSNWYFEDLGAELQQWLVEDCRGMKAQAAERNGHHEVRVVFYTREGDPKSYIHDTGYSRPLSEKWAHICRALDQWAQAVYRARPNVVVDSKWSPGSPPGTDLVDIVRVEEGPRVGGPMLGQSIGQLSGQ
jgi:excisionase family DNA binding protein